MCRTAGSQYENMYGRGISSLCNIRGNNVNIDVETVVTDCVSLTQTDLNSDFT